MSSIASEPETIRVSGLVEESIVDGPGLRYVVFTQGCPHRCPGCHNPQTHDFNGGEERRIADIAAAIADNPLLAGVTLSGGEPFCQPAACAALARAVHAQGRHVVTYSGYTLEQLRVMAAADTAVAALLQETDVLIDGPYIEAQRDLTLPFRGSANQRVIDLKEKRKNGSSF